jgi:hypothetical protein
MCTYQAKYFQVILPKCCYCYPTEIDRFMQQYRTSMPQQIMGVLAWSGLKITGKIGKGGEHTPLNACLRRPLCNLIMV